MFFRAKKICQNTGAKKGGGSHPRCCCVNLTAVNWGLLSDGQVDAAIDGFGARKVSFQHTVT